MIMEIHICWIYQILSFLVTKTVHSTIRTETFTQLVNYKDNYVSTGTRWTMSVRSKQSCAINCQVDLQCQAFFYKDNICIGYPASQPNDNYLIPNSGMVFYQRKVDCPIDYTIDETTGLCYKMYSETPKSWPDARQHCQNEDASLIILDTQEKLNSLRTLPAQLCLGVFVPILNRCYWITDSVKTWYDSKTECTNGGGVASSFPDVATYEYVVNEGGINGSTEELWIGVNDVVSEMNYKNVDGSDLSFTSYLFDYLTLSQNNRDGMVIDPTKNCIWEERDDYIDKRRMLCQTDTVVDFWMGGFQDTDLSWRWEDGQLMNLTAFKDGQPTINPALKCTTLDYLPSSYAFQNQDCQALKKFVCQKQ